MRQRLSRLTVGLQGRLTLSYVAVTVAALLALEIIGLLLILGLTWATDANITQYANDVVFTLWPQAAVYHTDESWDINGVQTWVDDVYVSGVASHPVWWKNDIQHETVRLHFDGHGPFYPDAYPIAVKI